MMSVTQDQFDKCCEITAESSKSLATICNEIGCTYKAMRYYIGHSDVTRAKYAQAKEDQADYLAEQIVEISDDSSDDEILIETETGTIRKENKEFVNRSRLRVDARKWVAAHLKPKKYSDHIDVTSNGETISTADTLSSARKRASQVNGDKQ